MKEQITLILFLGFFTLTFNESFSQLESDNEIKWEERSKINWEDFQGKIGSIPKLYVGKHEPQALTTTHIEGHWNIHKVDSIICQFQITEISVTGVFEKNNSWVIEKEKTDYLLTHEQGHFDISEIAAQIFEQNMLYKIFPCSGKIYNEREANSIIKNIIEKTQININMQKNYDLETNGGKNKSEQHFWNLKIKTQLVEYYPLKLDFLPGVDFVSKYTRIIYDKQIECTSGWEVMEKFSDSRLVCVTPAVASNLVERNWGRIH